MIPLETICYEEEKGIGILTLSREKQLNAINSTMLSELKTSLEEIKESSVRCLIITGKGEKAFVAGADIASMSRMSEKEAKEFSILGNSVMREIETLPIPVIACINGYALGGGLEISLACDIRIAGEKAVFGQPEVTLGITPGFGGTQRLQRAIGKMRAKKMIFTGKNINAKTALIYGLVDEVVENENVLDEALKIASKIASNPPKAVKACKKAIDYISNHEIEEATSKESEIFSKCFTTGEQEKQMGEFLTRRKK